MNSNPTFSEAVIQKAIRSAAHAVPENNGGVSLIDKRAASIAQMKGPVVQRATVLNWTPQNVNVASAHGIAAYNGPAGHTATAVLDPTDEIAGHETSSTEYPALYNLLNATYNQSFVRGHLMNADFGGSNVAANLFPITSKANGLHKSNVENHVKGWMKDANTQMINYDVTANAGVNTVEDATFVCNATRVNKKGMVDKTIERTITSSPQSKTKGVRAYGLGDTEGWSYPGISNVWKWMKGTTWIHGGPLGAHARTTIDAMNGGAHLQRDSATAGNHGYS